MPVAGSVIEHVGQIGADRSIEVNVTRGSLRRFWHKPSLARLSA